jgi:hypothetical protein
LSVFVAGEQRHRISRGENPVGDVLEVPVVDGQPRG